MAELTPEARAGFAAIVLATVSLSAAMSHAQPSPLDPPTQQSVLILAADDFTRPYLRLIFEAFSSTVTAGSNAPDVYFESVDVTRFEEPHYRELARDWLVGRYQSRRIDLVVPVGQDAIEFLFDPAGSPWPSARVLVLETAGVKIDVARDLPGAGGILLQDLNASAIAMARTVFPATSHVALIAGFTGVEQARWNGIRAAVKNAGLAEIDLTGTPVEDLPAQIARLPTHSIVFVLAPTVDASGRVLSPTETCKVVANAARPAFTLAAHDLGCGVVGGRLRDWSAVGRQLGMEALARLQSPSTAVVELPLARYTTLAFDDRQLVKWGVPASRLPADAEIRFREPSLWRDHRSTVLAAAAFTLVQSALIAGLVWERRRRRHAEVESRRNLVAIAHLDRRAAMGELATSLAHELNQPLNAILQNVGVAQMMLRSHTLPPALTELADIINDIGRDDTRASEMIRRMRDLLRKQDLEWEVVDLVDVAAEAALVVRADAGARGTTIEVEPAGPVSPVRGNRVHLQQVVLNLLLNAMDAVTGLSADRRRVRVAVTSLGTEVRLSVSDAGIGIPPGQIETIFEPFFTTKAGGHGMGMGLAIVRGIIDAHGGRVGASNNATAGATVWFTVPHADGPGHADTVAGPPSDEGAIYA